MKALDLFCGAGGATEGLRRAGYFVVGIDIKTQPNYRYPLWQESALEIKIEAFRPDFVWASPPCQAQNRRGQTMTWIQKYDPNQFEYDGDELGCTRLTIIDDELFLSVSAFDLDFSHDQLRVLGELLAEDMEHQVQRTLGKELDWKRMFLGAMEGVGEAEGVFFWHDWRLRGADKIRGIEAMRDAGLLRKEDADKAIALISKRLERDNR